MQVRRSNAMELVTATAMRIGKWMMTIYVITKIDFLKIFSQSQAKGPIYKFLADMPGTMAGS